MGNAIDSAISTDDQSSVGDWRALGDLVELATQRVADPVEGVHHAIADRWSGFLGRYGDRSTRPLTRGIYGAVRLVGSVAGASLGIGAATVDTVRPVRPLWRSPTGAGVQAGVNALWGDEFERRASRIHIDLAVRTTNGTPVTCDAEALSQAFPTATPRLAVLLHGLGKTEHSWNRTDGESGEIVGLPGVLEADGFTPVLVRYNTGRSVSDNGAALSRVLAEVTAHWPTEVDEIVLVGHSMGGLVARSSLAAGRSAGQRWVNAVGHIVTLGTPHLGSPIEKGVDIASRILDREPISRPVSQFVNDRSAGIKDMRHGTIHDDRTNSKGMETPGCSESAARSGDGVLRHQVASVVTGSASHPVGFLVGDLVVRVTSATGIASSERDQPHDMRVFGGLHHMGMLYDSAVHAQIRAWLTPPRATGTQR
jgi:pimeloyl-ACP methyl ester carboxylesterase